MEVLRSSFEYLLNLYLIYRGTKKPQALVDIKDIRDAFYEDPEEIPTTRRKKKEHACPPAMERQKCMYLLSLSLSHIP